MSASERTKPTRHRPQRWTYWVAFCYLLTAPTLAVAFGMLGAASLLAGVGAVGVLLVRLDDIVSLSAFGVSARLERKIDEADDVLDQLRSLALAISEPALAMLAAEGRQMADLSARYKYDLRSSINRTLKELGVAERRVQEANSAYNEAFRYYLTSRVLAGAPEQTEDAELRRLLLSMQRIPPPASSEIRQLLAEASLDTPDRLVELRHLERFERDGELPDPDILPGTDVD